MYLPSSCCCNQSSVQRIREQGANCSPSFRGSQQSMLIGSFICEGAEAKEFLITMLLQNYCSTDPMRILIRSPRTSVSLRAATLSIQRMVRSYCFGGTSTNNKIVAMRCRKRMAPIAVPMLSPWCMAYRVSV